MKISKCKKELARIISEHGGWRNGEFAAQDGDGGVGGYDVKPEWNSLSKYWWREACGEWFLANKIKNHHQAVLSRAEYFHLYPAPDADGWIACAAGECPVSGDQVVDVKFRDGETAFGHSNEWIWSIDDGNGDIVAYRLHGLEQSTVETRLADAVDIVKAAAPALMSDEMKFTGDEVMGEIKPTLDQLLQDYRNAKECAGRKRQEADDAKADAEVKLAELVAAGNVLGLVIDVRH